ncbi:MAG: TolB family protein [Capsulimonadaceae bacterium]
MIAFTSGTPHGIPNLWVTNTRGSRTYRQLTTRGANTPMWIPGSHTIVFGTLRTGIPTYMTIDADSAADSEQPAANIPAKAQDPVWTADGALFAYAVPENHGKARKLCFGRTAGGGTTGLTRNFWIREWAWSPDNSKLAFIVGKAIGSSLWTMDIQSKEMVLIYNGYCSSPAYSPDGKRIAIAVPDVNTGFTISIVDLATEAIKRLAVQSYDGQKLVWSPAGDRLYFASGRKHEPAIWSIGVDGSGLTRVTPAGTKASGLSLSPDGQQIAYSATDKSTYSSDLFISDTQGKHITKLTTSEASYWSPVWSPDGTRIAYQSDIKHDTQIFVSRDDGSRARAVSYTTGKGQSEMDWVNDNRRILLQDVGKLIIIDTSARKNTTTVLSLLDAPAQNIQLHGDDVYYTEWQGANAHITEAKLDGSAKRLVTKPAPPPAASPDPAADPPKDTESTGKAHLGLGLMSPTPSVVDPADQTPPQVDATPSVSPDGKDVAFARLGQIWLVDSDGTNERKLTSFEATDVDKRLVTYPVWTPRGDSLLFLSMNNEAGTMAMELWISGTTPNTDKMIYSEAVDTEYGYYYLACTTPPVITPDGQRVVFTSLANRMPSIASVTLDGKDLRQIVPAPAAFPALAPAGDKLAYVDLTGGVERIGVLNLATGDSTRVPR